MHLDETLGRSAQDVFRIINEKTRAPAEDLVARVLNEKRPVSLANDTALVTKDGREVPIEGSAAPILDASGNVTGVVLVLHDITEKQRAQQALRESEKRYRNLFETMNEGFALHEIICDDKGWPRDYRFFLQVNPAFERLTGLKAADLVGRTLHEVLPQSESVWVDRYGSVALTGQPAHFDQWNKALGRHYEVSAFQTEKGRFAVVFLDITERKRAEDELRKAHDELEMRVQERTIELERANKTLEELSSRLMSAHEEERKKIAGEIHDTLGSCLSGVKYKIEDVLHRIGKDSNVTEESLRSLIPVVQEGIEECRRIQQDLRPSILDDLGLLATLSWFYRTYQTIYTGIKIDVEQTLEEKDIPDSLKIVIYRVTQEGMNNIAKHSKANHVRFSLRRNNDRIEFTLQDNGRGFDVDKALGSESTRRGLGLTSMKERVELSGGSYDIKSVQGKGTIIRVSWPF